MRSIKTRVIFVSSLVFLLFLSYFTMAKSSPPSIDDVLKGPTTSLDWKNVLIGFFALSFGTLSAAKAYEIFKKAKSKKEEDITEFCDSEMKNLKTEMDRLTCEVKYKNAENESLRGHIHRLEEAMKEKSSNEELLKKSISSLRKECEKFLHEKEKLTLELSCRNLADLLPKEEKKSEAKIPEIEEKIEKITAIKKHAKAKKEASKKTSSRKRGK